MRFSVSLEIDAAALFFPITVAGRLRAAGTPELPRPGRLAGTLGRGIHRGCWKVGGPTSRHWRFAGFPTLLFGHRRLSVAFGALGHPLSVPESERHAYGKPVEKQRLSGRSHEIWRGGHMIIICGLN